MGRLAVRVNVCPAARVPWESLKQAKSHKKFLTT